MERVLPKRRFHDHLNGTATKLSAPKKPPAAPPQESSKAHVLVPIRLDGSAEELRTPLALAASLRPGAKLTLLHVLTNPDTGDRSFHWLGAIERLHKGLPDSRLTPIEKVRASILARIERDIANPLREVLKVHAECRIGEPAVEMARFAREQSVDLVILSNTPSGWRLPLWSRLCERVVRLTEAPVILVRPTTAPRQTPTAS